MAESHYTKQMPLLERNIIISNELIHCYKDMIKSYKKRENIIQSLIEKTNQLISHYKTRNYVLTNKINTTKYE